MGCMSKRKTKGLLIEVKRNHTQDNEKYIRKVAKELGDIKLAVAERMILTQAMKSKILLGGTLS